MNITGAAIDKNRVTAVALLVVILAGYSAYQEMPRDEDPGFIIRVAQVMTFFPGASPERVELLVSDKLEKAIMEIPQLDFVSSTSRTGVSLVFANIQESEQEMRPIWDDLRRKIERAGRDLPEGIIGPFVNDEFGDVFGTILTITGEGFTYAELKKVADQVRNELLKIPEAAKVEIHGAQEERVFIEYNHARLAELGLSAVQLGAILESRNIVLPGGDINTGFERIALEPSGNFDTVEDIRRTIINVPGTRELVYLEDIARVERGYVDPPQQKIRSSGERSLALGISLREGGNLITLGREVQTIKQRLEAIYPIGLEFDIIAFQPAIVEKKVDDFISNLLQAVAIVIVVMLLTLGLRTGLVVSSLIPMAIVMSLLVMSFFSIGLDQMSLSALIIALGLLVDNAIVMSESIMVGMAAGRKGVEAALESARELRIPLLTSSLTTAAAFLPIYLAESATGEYTAPLFKVVTITLLCSWILALTMIPMLCVAFIKIKIRSGGSEFDGRLHRLYRSLLLPGLKRPLLSLGAAVVFFLLVMQGFRFIPNIFFPPKDQATFTVELELPIGAPIERTEAVVDQVEALVAEHMQTTSQRTRGVTNWAAFIGQGPPRYTLTYSPRQASPEYAMLLLNTTDYEIIADLVPRLETFCLETFPDVKPTVRGMLNGPPITNPIEVRLSGEKADQVFAMADRLKAHLASLPGTKNISDNWGLQTKKLLVHIDQPRARRAGLTSQDVAVSLQTVLSGLEITQYREEDLIIPVTLRSPGAGHRDLDQLESLNITAPSGLTVPLKQVADIDVAWEPAKILRRNRLKTVTVSAGIGAEITAMEVFAQIQTWLEQEKVGWPPGYDWEFGGEWEASVEANESIAVKLPIAGLIILLLLVGQFNSIRRPAIIFMTIPLGLVGVVIGLLVTGLPVGFMTFLGIISLFGIVINNAIVLLDRIKIEIEERGLDPARAVVEAAQRRLRPIVLTTGTTIGGMLPLWYGGGPMFAPMAVAIIFGLLFATLLTLGLVPVLYALFFRVRFKEFVY
ncbi:MAG: MMPL family transporter [Candidatus Latescibacteria bacterium]|nr:MMPL family transporter [Candidatus Latescibacterota bacterium]